MKICFPDPERQRLFNHAAKLRAAFGEKLASRIQCRLSCLNAARHLGWIERGKVFDLRPEDTVSRSFSVHLDDANRLYFRAAGDAGAMSDLVQVDCIEIFGVDGPSSQKVFAS